MKPPIIFSLTVVTTVVLCGCITPTPKSDARQELLKSLRACRDAIPKQVDQPFESPCRASDVSSLMGISRADLVVALGPPSFCVGVTEGGFPRGTDCPPHWNPEWSFYRLPAGRLGGGPELLCETTEDQRCDRVMWVRSQ